MTKLRLSACAAVGVAAVAFAPDWIELNAPLAVLIWVTFSGAALLLQLKIDAK